jgi:hypothetical protein
MTESPYAVQVRRERDHAFNPSAEPMLRQYADIERDVEAAAILLTGGSIDVTAVHLRSDYLTRGIIPGAPVDGLYVTVRVWTFSEGEPEYAEGGNNRGVTFSWPGTDATGILLLSDEAAVMRDVLAKAGAIARLVGTQLRLDWWVQHELERRDRATAERS